MEEMSSRRKRINRLKKVILGMAAAILIPSVVCIILGVRLAGLSARAKELEELLLAEKSRSAESGNRTEARRPRICQRAQRCAGSRRAVSRKCILPLTTAPATIQMRFWIF